MLNGRVRELVNKALSFLESAKTPYVTDEQAAEYLATAMQFVDQAAKLQADIIAKSKPSEPQRPVHAGEGI